MTETPTRKPRPRRTFSAFGDVRRMPSEYEIVTHAQNWTLRQNRAATFEQNPSSVANLWFLTYRDNSPLKAENWDAYRDPDALTYKAYVNLQAEAETKVGGVLEAHAEVALDPGSVALLGRLFTPSRYLYHGCQQVEAYIGYMAPSSYITNAAAFSTADFLRRVTTVAYRTRELQIASPDSGIGSAERSLWEGHDGWQAARKAIEYALVSYDWGEAFTALNLVLAPTLEDVLLTQLGQVAKSNNDDLTWLLTSFLGRGRQAPGPVEPGPGRGGRSPAPGEPCRARQVVRPLVRAGRRRRARPRDDPRDGAGEQRAGGGRRRAREDGPGTVSGRAA